MKASMLDAQRRLTSGFYALIALPATAMGFALSIQISALSWLLTTRYQLDIHQVGLVWAAGPLAGIIGQVLVGLVSDRVWFWGGRRRPFILIGGTLAALMVFALPRIDTLASASGIGNLLVVATAIALLLDLAINVSFNPTRSVIADVTPDGEPRTRGYTWMQTISGFFGVLAYVIGAAAGNIVLIHVGVAVVFLFSVVPILFVTEPREFGASSRQETQKTPAQGLTRWRELLMVYGAHAFSWIGVQTMFVYIIAFLQQKFALTGDAETTAADLGRVLAISFAILNIVGFLLPAPVLEPLAKRFGRVRVHTVAVAIMALGYAGVSLAGTTPLGVYLFMAVLGIGWASIVSLPFAIMSELVDKSRMGFFMGIFNLSVVFPQLFVSLVLGRVILEAADKSVIFWISTAALGISAVAWAFVRESRAAIEVPPAAGGGA